MKYSKQYKRFILFSEMLVLMASFIFVGCGQSPQTTLLEIAAPNGLVATVFSSDRIDLSWSDNSDNETYFIIERRIEGGSYIQLASVPVDITIFADVGLAPGITYYYRVCANRDGVHSSHSNVVDARTPEVAPIAPGGLGATTLSAESIALAWTDNSANEVGFKIERSLSSGSGFSQIWTVDANITNYTSTGLTPTTIYYYRVRAFNGAGDSGYSNEDSSQTMDPPLNPPTAPNGLGATTLSTDSITLSWTDNSANEVGFKIERSLSSGSGFSQIGSVDANITNYISTGLTANTIYYYRVRTFNATGDSNYSNEATDRTFDVSADQIIADHTVVAKYNFIPQFYIDKVKTMLLNLPGESHSMAYRLGVLLVMQQDSKYAVSVDVVGWTPPEESTNNHLRVSNVTWGDRSRSNWWVDSYGEEDFYVDDIALNATKNHIAYCAMNNREIDVLGFVWCYDMMYHNEPGGTVDPFYNVRWAGASVGGPDGDSRWGLDDGDIPLTGNTVTMNNYLMAVESYNAFSQSNGYRTKAIFTTGPIDSFVGEHGYQRYIKHEYIRNFVLTDSNRILLDYADILSYNNLGNQNTTSYDGNIFGIIHPDNMLDMDGTYTKDGDHIGERGALRLGKAIWWMLARISGWDGVSTD